MSRCGTGTCWAVVTAAMLIAAGCTSPGASATSPAAASSLAPSEAPVSPAASSTAAITLDPARWIVVQTCVDCSGQDEQLWLEHPGGNGSREITSQIGGIAVDPDFSRDGAKLAFSWRPDDATAPQIYVAAADGTGAQQVTDCKPPACLGYEEPSWSADGTKLALYADFGPPVNGIPMRDAIEILDVRTGTITPVIGMAASDGQHVYPRWSPDGRSLLFWTDRVSPGGVEDAAVFIVGVDGQGLRQLTLWDEEAGDADWSPDGSSIVYCTHPHRIPWHGQVESEIETIRPDGSGRTALTNFGLSGPRATQPRWTPDGKDILYVRDGRALFTIQIWVIAADGSAASPLLTGHQIYGHPELQP